MAIKKRQWALGPGLVGPILMSGCVALGPDYSEPVADVEPNWEAINDTRLSNDSPGFDTSKWWASSFKDPELDRLVSMALNQNLSLRSAGLRVLQSKQQLAIAIGNQYPQEQQLVGSGGREKAGGVTANDYNLGFNASWEADFWGRFSRQIESASADLDASVANYDDVLISLVAQVAQNYIQIRTLQARIEVTQSNIRLQTESLRVATAKFEAGDASALDAEQAESLLYSTTASIPQLRTSLQQSKNALSTLLGKPPQSFNYLLSQDNPIPVTPANVALGMPQELIRRRPDIRLAERQLASQSAQIGFAETDLYPQLSIAGSIGTRDEHTSNLFTNDSQVWNLFGSFQWNIFNYGRLKSNVRLQDARFQQLLVDYRNTVLEAQGSVENAIVVYLNSHELLDSYRLASEASRRAVDISLAQYNDGLVDFNTVVGTLSSYTQQKDLYTQAKGGIANSLVQLYQELGGGWEVRNNVDPVELLPESTKETMLRRTDSWEGQF